MRDALARRSFSNRFVQARLRIRYSQRRVLFAEIHRKLSLDANDSERREDILTSTVFGSLVVGEKWSLLRAWLRAARDVDGNCLEVPSVSHPKYCFWPRLAEAEPDVLLLFDDVLVIIEAKYLSAKSGHDSEDQGTFNPADQLAREWRSCAPDRGDGCAPEVRDAIVLGGAKRALVYLVRQPTAAKTRRELEASRKAIGDQAKLYCLGWSDLAAVLRREQPAASGAWLLALAELLERRGFTSFGGFPRVRLADATLSALVVRWRLSGVHLRQRSVSFPRALSEVHLPSIRLLSLLDSHRERPDKGWSRVLAREKLAVVSRLAARPMKTLPDGDGT